MERLMKRRVVSKSRGGALQDRGVTKVEKQPLILECDGCGCRWMPNRGPGGKLGPQYWLCTSGLGCNHPDRD